MKKFAWLKGLAVGLACFGMVMPQHAFAAPADEVNSGTPVPTPGIEAPLVQDVALGEGGVLVGQAMSAEGSPLALAEISVLYQGKEVATTVTDAQGKYAVRGLRGGVHQVVAGNSAGIYRLWAPQTAPPAAQAGALHVADGSVVRGKLGDGTLLGNPLVLGGIIATAIAVPLAVANRNKKKGS